MSIRFRHRKQSKRVGEYQSAQPKTSLKEAISRETVRDKTMAKKLRADKINSGKLLKLQVTRLSKEVKD
jgi:hypothetical protein